MSTLSFPKLPGGDIKTGLDYLRVRWNPEVLTGGGLSTRMGEGFLTSLARNAPTLFDSSPITFKQSEEGGIRASQPLRCSWDFFVVQFCLPI